MSSRTTTTRTTTVAAAILAAGALAAGCSSLSGGGGGGPRLTTSPPTSSSPAPAGDSTAPTTRSAPAPAATPTSGGGHGGQCRTADLKVTVAKGSAGAGNHYQPIEFTNTGSTACTLRGWPGVSYVTSPQGEPVGAPASRAGEPRGPVTLPPGQAVSAVLDRVQVRNFTPSACHLTPVAGIRVYPPNNTASAFVPLPGAHACAGTNLPDPQLTIKAVGSGNR